MGMIRPTRRQKRRVASHTLDATIANYLEAKAIELKPRSFLEVKRHLERDWQALHSLAIANIGRPQMPPHCLSWPRLRAV